MANTAPLLCHNCGHFLIPMLFSGHTWLVCDNAKGRCRLFAERQVLISHDNGKEGVKGLAAARRYLAGNPARKIAKVVG